MDKPRLHKPHLAAVFFASMLALAALPATAEAKAFGPGEVLDFETEYLGITVGRAQLMVGSPTRVSGEKVMPLVVFAKTDPVFVLFPVKDKFVSWWNPETKISLGLDIAAEEGRKRRRERHRFMRSESKAKVVREREGEAKQEVIYDSHARAQDILGALYTLRTRPLKVGDTEELPVFTGKRTFQLKAHVEKKETIKVPAGTFEAKLVKVQVQFSGNLQSKRDILVWFTDDGSNTPLRISADLVLGSIEGHLTSRQKGITR